MIFDHLDDGEFEELTYELLVALGFVNVNWRRGSGRGGATADQGRDVVAQENHRSVDGNIRLDTWFIQCKHYSKGVPPEKLQGALTWSASERPAVLLFVVSNFLSNPSKNYLEEYERNNKPPFRIRLWERKDLERLLASHPNLMRKYRLEPDDPALSIHPAHLHYALGPTVNSPRDFFSHLDQMDPAKRDEIFSWSYHWLIGPRYREPKHDHETFAEMQIDPVDYQTFKQKFHALITNQRVADHFLIQAVICDALGWSWRFGDPSQVETFKERHKEAIARFEEKRAKTTDLDDIADLNGVIAISQEAIQTAEDRQRKWHGYYLFLCEHLIPALALDDLRSSLLHKTDALTFE